MDSNPFLLSFGFASILLANRGVVSEKRLLRRNNTAQFV